MKKKISVLMCAILVIGSLAGCAKKEEKKPEPTKKEEVTEEVKKEEEEEVKKEESDGKIIAGTNQSDATPLPLDSKIFAKVKKDSNAWFAFTTGEDENAVYNATIVNMTADSSVIYGYLYDEYGEQLNYQSIYNDGKPVSLSSEELTPNTTYYISIDPNGNNVDYSVIVKNINAEKEANKTVSNVLEAKRVKISEDGTVTTGTNRNDAALVPLATKIKGNLKKDSNAWFAFTTGAEENFTYNATIVNMTADSDVIYGYLYDEYGNQLNYQSIYNDGKPVSLSSEELIPNTTYYIQLNPNGNNSVDFSLIIKSPDAKDLKAGLVFEKPLEINETQVQFEAEKAKFIDENAAKEVLRPVAEAILEKSESVVLIVGTTATDGEQEARVKLSNERAEAVKNLLVKTYKVPEKQIKTVGLGFEADPFERGKDRDSSGKFVESEGRKNRRVVILDASDEIAQGILNNNK